MQTNEQARLAALRSYHILDTLEEQDFDDLTTLAAAICQVPIALISLVDEKRQWFKSHKGLMVSETPIEQSFCAHAISTQEMMVVEDAHEDERFKDNPLVTGGPNITFYAGVPLVNEDGYALGTLCVIDDKRKKLTAEQEEALKVVARQVKDKLELRRKILALEATNKALTQAKQELYSANENLRGVQFRLRDTMNAAETVHARFRSMIQSSSVAMLLTSGAELVFEEINEPMLRMIGKDRSVIGKAWYDAMPELIGQPIIKVIYQTYYTGKENKVTEAPVTILHNGEPHYGYYNITYTALKENGKITGVMQSAVNVTEQVNAREAIQKLNKDLSGTNKDLQAVNAKLSATNDELHEAQESLMQSNHALTESRENLALAIASADLGIWSINLKTQHLTVNDRYKHMLGFSLQEDLTTEQVLTAILPEYRPEVEKAIQQAINHTHVFNVMFPVNHQVTGEQIWVHGIGNVYTDAEGQPVKFTGMNLNITEQKKNDQRKNDFIGMVSHELKTPLTSMTGFIQMLMLKAKKNKDNFTLNVLEKATRQAQKMTTLINGFLNVSRLEAGKIYIDRQRFDMAELITESEDEALTAVTSHKIVFAPVKETLVNADRDKIGQVITNFISNAAKYSPQDTTIQVTCVTINGRAQVSVRDEGMGISPKDQEKLFDRFYRVESSQTKSIAGFGIGLYLCAEIVHRHEGRIWVESEPGKGSAFYFDLPVEV